MKKEIKIYKILKINIVLERLIEQDCKYEINTSYKLYKLKKEINNIENYIFDRFYKLFNGKELEQLSNNERIIYNTILDSTIEINIPNISVEDILKNKEIKMSVQEIEIIEQLLAKN